jgi:hypothetical protein
LNLNCFPAADSLSAYQGKTKFLFFTTAAKTIPGSQQLAAEIYDGIKASNDCRSCIISISSVPSSLNLSHTTERDFGYYM